MKLIAILLLASAPAFSNTLLQDTAIIALRAAHDSATGTVVEHGGMLIKSGDDYRFVEPAQGDETGIRVVDFSQLKAGEQLIGTYHTHLCMAHYYHGLFSKQDVIAAYLTGVPEFMLDECTGEVHEFNSRVDHVWETGVPSHIFGKDCEKVDILLPVGRVVGNIGETEVLREAVYIDPCKKDPPAA